MNLNIEQWEMKTVAKWTTSEIKNRIWLAADGQPIPGCVSVEALRLELIRRGEEPRGYHNS